MRARGCMSRMRSESMITSRRGRSQRLEIDNEIVLLVVGQHLGRAVVRGECIVEDALTNRGLATIVEVRRRPAEAEQRGNVEGAALVGVPANGGRGADVDVLVRGEHV